MSIRDDTNKGLGLKPLPFVIIHEKLIDGLIFHYAEYQNQAYIAINDVATELKIAHPKSRASDFKRRFKPKFPHYFKKFQAMTPGGPQEINFATLEAINIFCSRSRNVEVAVEYITKLTQFQKWFLSTRRDPIIEQTNKIKGDYNFLSSEIKFLHDNNSLLRRDVTTLAQAVKQLQTQLDANIDRYQVKKIYDLLNKKLAVVVAEKQGLAKPTPRIYRDVWNAFYEKFKIASYRDLPASQFEDAEAYLLYQIEKVSKELE